MRLKVFPCEVSKPVRYFIAMQKTETLEQVLINQWGSRKEVSEAPIFDSETSNKRIFCTRKTEEQLRRMLSDRRPFIDVITHRFFKAYSAEKNGGKHNRMYKR